MHSRRLAGAVVVTLLIAAAIGPVLGAAGPVGSAPASAGSAEGSVGFTLAPGAADSTSAFGEANQNDTTSTPVERHEHPENSSGDGNLSTYRAWLAGRMGQALVDCTEGAKARQFGACDLQNQYPEWLSKYVDVARETEGQPDDEAADAFENAREDQRKFNDKVRRFWRTREAYRRARERGNTERARRLARRLGRIGSDVEKTSGNLTRNYTRITNATAVDLGGSRRTVENITGNVTRVAQDTRDDAFVATTLTVRADSTDTSFLDPLEVSGRLTTENGSAVANRHIHVAIEGRPILTQTDENGQFTLSYRPRSLPLATERVTVRYVPENVSAYLPARSTLPVTVEQVTPTVTVSRQPGTVAFGDTLVVNGSVGAGGINARSVPVRVVLAGEDGGGARARTVRTEANGTYRAEFTVPATVSEGDRGVRSTVALADRALGPGNATTSVTVVESETWLGLRGTATGSGRIKVEGRLRTVDGRPIEGQSIRFVLGGTTVESVRTGQGGQFATTLRVPDRVRNRTNSSTRVRVDAQFDATGTNLAPAHNATFVPLSGGPVWESAGDRLESLVDTRSDELATWSTWDLILAGGGLLALLGLLGIALFGPSGRVLDAGTAVAGLVAGRLRASRNGTDEPAAPTETAGSAESDGVGASSELDREAPAAESVSPFQRAQRHLARGDTDRAVVTAYTGVRGQIDTGGGSTPPTHWEFFDSARDRLPPEEVELFQFFTKAYELAAFGPTSVDAEVASAALNVAERLEEQFDTSPSDSATPDEVDGEPGGGTGESGGGTGESGGVAGESGGVASESGGGTGESGGGTGETGGVAGESGGVAGESGGVTGGSGGDDGGSGRFGTRAGESTDD